MDRYELFRRCQEMQDLEAPRCGPTHRTHAYETMPQGMWEGDGGKLSQTGMERLPPVEPHCRCTIKRQLEQECARDVKFTPANQARQPVCVIVCVCACAADPARLADRTPAAHASAWLCLSTSVAC